MADIRAAAKALHDSREALPEHARVVQWLVIGDGEPAVIEAGGMWVADCGYNARPAAEHIARCASPDVTEATQRLLEAVSNARRSELDDDVYRAADVLAAAILREDR